MLATRLGPVLHHLRTLTPNSGSEASDADLLERVVGGRDEAAFTALLRRHGAMVLAVGQRILGCRHAAEDVFQATFLLLAQRARSIRRHASLAGWLHGVARRLAVRAGVSAR